MDLIDKIKLFNGNSNWTTYSTDQIPQIFMCDGPHGLRKQDFDNYSDLNKSNIATCFPTGSCIASSWNKQTIREMGKLIAREALAENVQLVLGPAINIKRSPLCGRNFEYYSEDPYLAGMLTANYVIGMQEAGVGTCVKHFTCNNQEYRRQTSSSNMSLKTLHKIYLRPFEIAVRKAAPTSIMCSYNKVNGVDVSQNSYLLNDVLRKRWGFNGVVVSDWGACLDAVKCVKAGMDLAMPYSHGYFDKQLKEGIENGSLKESDLDTANERVISMAKKLKKMREDTVGNEKPTVNFEEHYQKAVEMAQESAVLLKNDGFFPLLPCPIIIIGDLAKNTKFQGGGSSHITTAPRQNAIQTFQNAGFNVTYLSSSAVRKLKKIIQTNPDIPVLYFCGLTEYYEGEGFDRENMNLPAEQLATLSKIFEVTKNVGIISFSGAPIDLQPAQEARSILHMYLSGVGCAQAVCNLVSGHANPSGHLAETWPCKVQDTPCYGNFANDCNEIEYSEGELVGYRWYNAMGIKVQYPFGFGLSYSEFEVKLEGPQQVTVKNEGAAPRTCRAAVTNKGGVAGAEVVQIYSGLKNTPKVLRGFEKVFLQPGETKTIDIELDDYTFCDYITEQDSFVFIPGEYEFSVNEVLALQKVESPRKEIQLSMSNSLSELAPYSLRIRLFLKLMTIVLRLRNHCRPLSDPSVRIQVSAIFENPLASLISTSGGAISEKFARRLLSWAKR